MEILDIPIYDTIVALLSIVLFVMLVYIYSIFRANYLNRSIRENVEITVALSALRLHELIEIYNDANIDKSYKLKILALIRRQDEKSYLKLIKQEECLTQDDQ